MRKWLKNIGPGVLVSAAFIGPGTVTVCTIAGVNFQFALLWALGLSIISCIVLQEMAARLGIISQKGLSDCIREEIKNPVARLLSILLILSAIVIGNAAYEAGNITGAVLGISTIASPVTYHFGDIIVNFWSIVVGFLAILILYLGNSRFLERVFIFLVALMSLSFLITAVLTKPDISELFQGIFIPRKSSAGILTIIALIGTTVVPYNLFLHASLVKDKWHKPEDLPWARKELIYAIILGGLVSMAIVVCSSSLSLTNVKSAADLALGLEPLYGNYAKWFIATGLFAAGITSSITAPLAAAYVVAGCFGWKNGINSAKFKLVWMAIIITGVIVSTMGLNPIEIIQFAQVANGILLPVIAIFLFWIVNRSGLMGNYRNSLQQNILGAFVILISLFLGAKSIYTVFFGY